MVPIFITKINNMKTNIIKAILGLILTFFISGLYAQSPRIKLNQIVKDSITGSVLISGADSNMVYSRNFYIGSDTSLVFYGTTIVAGSGGGGSFVTVPQLNDSLALYATKVQLSDSIATVLKQVATDLTLTGNGTVASPLKVDTSVIATVKSLKDSLAGILTTVSTYVTLTGNGSIASPLKVDTTTYIATKGDLATKQNQLNGTGFVKATGTTISYDNSTYYLASNPNGYTSNTGTVTSVAATAGTGISISGSPITGAGTLTITNTAPDQTVSITGAGINSVSGTYPSFTITGTEVDGSTTNELQTISYNSGTNVLTLSNSGGTADLSDLDLVDSTRLLADSILVYYQNGSEIGRDTISGISGGGGGGGSGTVTSVDVSGGTTGLTTSGGPITTSGTITIAGTLDVDNGGTGATTLASGGYLKGNGTSAITSQTGIPASDITSGTLGVERGGTGATTFTANQVLKGNGTSAIQAALNLRDVVDTVFVDKFLNVDTATLYVDNVNNRVGIGTKIPERKLSIVENGNAAVMSITTYRNQAGQSTWSTNFARGTENSPLIVQNGDVIGEFTFNAYTGSSFPLGQVASVFTEVNGTVTSSPFSAPTDLIFATSSTGTAYASPRLRIKSDGEVWIANSTDQGAYNLQVGGTGVWGAGAYVNGSDITLKENIQPLNQGLYYINKLNPVQYNYKSTFSTDQSKQIGFIAQDVLIALEDLSDAVVKDAGQTLSMAYQNLIPLAIKAIQEQQSIIETQATEIEQLKTQIQLILNEIQILKNN
jgi:hypothetical protein